MSAGYGCLELVELPGKVGITVSGSDARSFAAGSVGKYKSPRWPQALSAAVQTARAMHRTKIW